MTTTYIIIFFASLLGGFVLFKILLAVLPKRLAAQNKGQAAEVISEARRQKASIFKSKIKQLEEELELEGEELAADLESAKEELLAEDAMITERLSELSQEDKRLKKIESEVNEIAENVEKTAAEFESLKASHQQMAENLQKKLELAAGESSDRISEALKNNLIEARQIQCQKVLKTLNEEMSSSARKKAQSILDRTHSRYMPDFAWPKNSNLVESNEPGKLELFWEKGQQTVEQMKELAGIEISAIESNREENVLNSIKVMGGFGIHREAARLTILNLVENKQISRAEELYNSHLKRLNQIAKQLGRRATSELRLEGIHPEIEYLIGALNWRTSYRQNQWYHTVEVAVLAGLIANEVGIDPDHAKRVGLLHDIGKAIDYRIEGSHAVISGDYADRYGEDKTICDTVMSHHADLLVETPLAYTLIAADTLSGARPGARVNLEEGYQIRLSAIADVVNSFPGISDMAIMNGGREVHLQVNYKKVSEQKAAHLASEIARKIESDVAYPGQIKVLVSRCFENVTVA